MICPVCAKAHEPFEYAGLTVLPCPQVCEGDIEYHDSGTVRWLTSGKGVSSATSQPTPAPADGKAKADL